MSVKAPKPPTAIWGFFGLDCVQERGDRRGRRPVKVPVDKLLQRQALAVGSSLQSGRERGVNGCDATEGVVRVAQESASAHTGRRGRSSWLLGMRGGLRGRAADGTEEKAEAPAATETAGDGRTGVSARPRPSRGAFLGALIFWRKATFSSFTLPKAVRE